MRKSPEDYFREQSFSVEPSSPGEFTPAERAFMDKYMGLDSAALLEQLGLPPLPPPPAVPPMPGQQTGEGSAAPAGRPQAPEQAPLFAAPQPVAAAAPQLADKPLPGASPAAAVEGGLAAEAAAPEEPLDAVLRREQEIQMVGFFIGGQEFTIPTVSVQEVIRFMPVAKLPAAPPVIVGVINLRGRVTPLIDLRMALEVNSPRLGADKFVIICRSHGLQVGMIIERVHTMYRVSQSDIEWGIEAHLGVNADYISGLFKLGEQLVSIVSVERVIAGILK
jgi:purine-binding chemotaxis protein CheW